MAPRNMRMGLWLVGIHVGMSGLLGLRATHLGGCRLHSRRGGSCELGSGWSQRVRARVGTVSLGDRSPSPSLLPSKQPSTFVDI